MDDGGAYYVKAISQDHFVATGDFVVVRGILDGSVPPAILDNAQYRVLVYGPRRPINGLTDQTIGKDLQIQMNGTLPDPVPYGGSLKVTITSSDPSKVLVSNDPAAVGSASTSVTVPGGSNNMPSFYVQALDSTGVVDVTATAPGGLGKTFKVTLAPSGFVIYAPLSISTTTFSGNTTVTIAPARLNPDTLAYVTNQNLRAGLSVNVPVTSSDTSVGTMTISPVTFTGGAGTAATAFDPANAGTTVIELGVPAGWSTPSTRTQITATVTAPDINAQDEAVGKDLQTSSTVNLTTAPPSPVDITVSVGSASVATITTDPAVEGTGSITFSGVSNTSARTFYVQGRSLGTTSLTVSAPGYNTRIKTITVDPSGFVIYAPSSITTTASAANSNVTISPARLNPLNFTYVTNQSLRGGMAGVSVTVTSSNTSVGVITVSPLAFDANVGSRQTQFDPLAAGTSTITVEPPAGFSTPTTRRQITATVNP